MDDMAPHLCLPLVVPIGRSVAAWGSDAYDVIEALFSKLVDETRYLIAVRYSFRRGHSRPIGIDVGNMNV